jgi:hypothetical protein
LTVTLAADAIPGNMPAATMPASQTDFFMTLQDPLGTVAVRAVKQEAGQFAH